MRRKSYGFLFFLILSSVCAPVATNIRITKEELGSLKKAEKVVIFSKDGTSHKIKRVTVNNEKICGVEQSFLGKARPITLEPSGIEGIYIKGARIDDGSVIPMTEIAKNRVSSSRYFLLLVSGAISIVPAIFLSFVTSGSDFSDENLTSTQEAIFTTTFYSTVFLVTYSGYKLGKNLDDRLALKEIKAKRKQAGN